MESEGGCDLISVSVISQDELGYAEATTIPRVFVAKKRVYFLLSRHPSQGSYGLCSSLISSFRSLDVCRARGKQIWWSKHWASKFSFTGQSKSHLPIPNFQEVGISILPPA